MRTRIISGIVLIGGVVGLACVSAAPAARADGPRADAPASGSASTPTGHYCNLGFFTPLSGARHKELVPRLAAATTKVTELENGYRFDFSGQFREAGEWADGVRGCCPTLDYDLHFDRQSGSAWLRVTGTNGAKEFIVEEFQPLFPKGGATR